MSIECQSFWYAWNTPRGDGDEVSPNHILGLISCHTRGLHSKRRQDVPIRMNVFRYYNDQSVSIELTSSLLLSGMNKNLRDFTKSFFYQLVAGIYTLIYYSTSIITSSTTTNYHIDRNNFTTSSHSPHSKHHPPYSSEHSLPPQPPPFPSPATENTHPPPPSRDQT